MRPQFSDKAERRVSRNYTAKVRFGGCQFPETTSAAPPGSRYYNRRLRASGRGRRGSAVLRLCAPWRPARDRPRWHRHARRPGARRGLTGEQAQETARSRPPAYCRTSRSGASIEDRGRQAWPPRICGAAPSGGFGLQCVGSATQCRVLKPLIPREPPPVFSALLRFRIEEETGSAWGGQWRRAAIALRPAPASSCAPPDRHISTYIMRSLPNLAKLSACRGR
jgi:hypothetical protein